MEIISHFYIVYIFRSSAGPQKSLSAPGRLKKQSLSQTNIGYNVAQYCIYQRYYYEIEILVKV